MHRKQARLLLVDDHPLVLQGVVLCLQQTSDLKVVATAASAEEALEAAAAHEFDVAVLDLNLPGMSGLELISAFRRDHADLGLVVMTMHDEEDFVLRAIALGAKAYILKDQSPDDLTEAIRAVHNGHSYFSPRIAGYLVSRVASDGRQPVRLTPRESEVLRRIAEGQVNRDIAASLQLSVRTVETYRERMMKKLDLHTVADLTRYAVAKGLVGVHEFAPQSEDG